MAHRLLETEPDTRGGGRPPRRRLDTFGALQRNPNFRLYWSGALLSNIGTWMQTLAQSWLVYQLTGSAFLLGSVSFLQGLPSLFLALVGGVLADRVERRRLMLVTQVAQMLLAVLLAGLTLTGVVRVEQIMVIAFLSGLVNAINTPVRQGIISDLVPRSDLQNAIAVNSAQFQTSQLLGPAIAGVVVATHRGRLGLPAQRPELRRRDRLLAAAPPATVGPPQAQGHHVVEREGRPRLRLPPRGAGHARPRRRRAGAARPARAAVAPAGLRRVCARTSGRRGWGCS